MTAPRNALDSWPVHPAAAAFRLMTDEERNELADSIKANGLIYPIVRGEWQENGQTVHGIIDGRNRVRACDIAEIEPSFTDYKGKDPCDFIFSVNGERRSINTGQKALAYALIFPKPAKGGRGKQNPVDLRSLGSTVGHARTVIEHAPELVENVKSGFIALDNAYRQALERQRAKQWLIEGEVHKKAPGGAFFSVDQLEDLTGILQQQQSRWRSHTKDAAAIALCREWMIISALRKAGFVAEASPRRGHRRERLVHAAPIN